MSALATLAVAEEPATIPFTDEDRDAVLTIVKPYKPSESYAPTYAADIAAHISTIFASEYDIVDFDCRVDFDGTATMTATMEVGYGTITANIPYISSPSWTDVAQEIRENPTASDTLWLTYADDLAQAFAEQFGYFWDDTAAMRAAL